MLEYTKEMLDDVGEVINRIIPLEAIKPHHRNYNDHPEAQVRDLMASDARFNQVRSIVVQQGPLGTYLLVAGHGYTMARKERGRKYVKADVIPASWPDEQVLGYLIADNELARQSLTNHLILAELLQQQVDSGYRLESIGQTQERLDAMLEELKQHAIDQGRKPTDEDGGGDGFDTSPDDTAPPRSQMGDIWQLGRHYLMVGDCLNLANRSRLLQGAKTLLLTDPPYGITLDSAWQNTVHRKNKKALNHATERLANDSGEITPDLFTAWPRRVVFGFPYLTDPVATGWFVWDKEPGFEGKSLTSPVEMAYSTTWKGFRIARLLWSGYMREANSEAKVGHPTQKPLRLLCDLIDAHDDEDIADLFLGSGTTLIACERMRRRCYAMEISPAYVDVTLRRWEAETGKIATLMYRDEPIEVE